MFFGNKTQVDVRFWESGQRKEKMKNYKPLNNLISDHELFKNKW